MFDEASYQRFVLLQTPFIKIIHIKHIKTRPLIIHGSIIVLIEIEADRCHTHFVECLSKIISYEYTQIIYKVNRNYFRLCKLKFVGELRVGLRFIDLHVSMTTFLGTVSVRSIPANIRSARF